VAAERTPVVARPGTPEAMESVNEIKEALSARSRTATLDELRSEGRKRVRLIRAEHVAAMISEAVHSAIDQSGLIAPEEVEKLVDKSRQEFRSILKEREQELQRAHDNEELLGEREAELKSLRAEFADKEHELTELRDRFEAVSQSLAVVRGELEVALAEVETIKATPAPAPVMLAAATPMMQAPMMMAAPVGASPDLVMSLMQEMATLKANLMLQQQQRAPAPVAAPAVAAAPAMPDFGAAFEKLAGSLNDRLEKLGKKMGVSAAVESNTPVDLGGLFRDEGKSLESNMQNIEIKQKAGGGIAANLARLKKLKGG
jgi:hypothetical protein